VLSKRYIKTSSPHLEELARQHSQYNDQATDWITGEVASIPSRDGYFSVPHYSGQLCDPPSSCQMCIR